MAHHAVAEAAVIAVPGDRWGERPLARAKVPVLNIVGDQATHHVEYDAPLQSDIETLARNLSGWVRTSKRTEQPSRDAVEAIIAATGPPGQVATLIVRADVAWRDGAHVAPPPEPATSPAASGEAIEAIAHAIRSGRRAGILLGGRALRERGLLALRGSRRPPERGCWRRCSRHVWNVAPACPA